METTFITTDSNGNKWYEIGGVTYGISPDGISMDEEGAPLKNTFSEENNKITEILEAAVAE